MSPEDKIDPLGAYREIKPIKQGSIFAKFRVKKKDKEKKEKETQKEKTTEHRIDIEA
ncbi:MAG: hypothetical protein NZ809_00290 [Thermodesulfovibrio sp.]|nr:hypothetical protein [Thermodesulfovibrio sp.]